MRKSTKSLGLKQLVEASRRITTHLELDKVLGQIVGSMAADLGAAFAMVWVVEHGDRCGACELNIECLSPGQCLHLKAWDGMVDPPGTAGAGRRLPVGVMKIGEIAARREPYHTDSLAGDPMVVDPEWVREHGIGGFAGFPIVRGDRLLGVLAYFGEGPNTPELLDILSCFAHHCASAIEDAQQYERVLESEEHYRALIDGAIDAVLIFTLGGDIVNCSRSASGMFGFPREALTMMNVRDLDIAPESKVFDFFGRLMAGGAVTYETTLATRSGNYMPVEVRAGTIKYGGGTAVQAFIRDITERKKLERQRADFISMVTHDLKGPLSVIMGYADVIGSEYGHALPQFAREGVESIGKSGEKLMGLVNDYLSLARLESGAAAIRKMPGSLMVITDRAMESVTFKAEEKKLKLEAVCPPGMPQIMADAGHLERAITNLLVNAVEHTSSGGLVRLVCSHDPERELVRVSVSDTGTGIPREVLPRIFEKYYSPGGAAKNGTGLGLAIVKSVAEGHGGGVSVESTEGFGSVFTITIPLR